MGLGEYAKEVTLHPPDGRKKVGYDYRNKPRFISYSCCVSRVDSSVAYNATVNRSFRHLAKSAPRNSAHAQARFDFSSDSGLQRELCGAR